MKKSSLFLVVSILLITNLWLTDRPQPEKQSEKPSAVPVVGNAQKLRTAYGRWKAANPEDRLTLGLRWSKGLSTEFTDAQGTATFDLVHGSISVEVSGLSEKDALDVWLVDNRTDGSVRPDSTDGLVPVGSLEHQGETAILESSIPGEFWGEFDLDLVVVTRSGKTPVENRLLFGTPSLFQRLYSRDQQRARNGSQPALAGFLLASPTPVATSDPEYDGLDDLVAKGEDLFFNETFNGNGRTCGTCHPAENNFTIDPEFIKRLPRKDPLFVAEFNDDLNFEKNGGLWFENPVLMREFGLIVENVDGFGDLANRFVMRGVPHTLGLPLSIKADPDDGTITPPNDRTGWSGDGAPGLGMLRDFAIGAVTQHFPKTLNRMVPDDFRMPTPYELDALEAFQLTLGRDEDLDFGTLVLHDPGAKKGLLLFGANSPGKCAQCHQNGGARFILPFGGPRDRNRNFDTGVEAFLSIRLDEDPAARALRPPDGGFGRNPLGTFTSVDPNPDGSFGNQTFNTPSLVEFADTLPGFHNNITVGFDLPNTVEAGVEFYNTPEFNLSVEGLFIAGINLDDDQVRDLGRLLRVINAMENERSAREYVERALEDLEYNHVFKRLTSLAVEEIKDATQVLYEVRLHPVTRYYFRRAKILLHLAPRIKHPRWRKLFLRYSLKLLELGRDRMTPN